LIEEKLAEARKPTTDTVNHIVGLGLESDYCLGFDLPMHLR
jgi:hypothetical protein